MEMERWKIVCVWAERELVEPTECWGNDRDRWGGGDATVARPPACAPRVWTGVGCETVKKRVRRRASTISCAVVGGSPSDWAVCVLSVS